jgi:heat shock protein HtpX
MAGTSVPEVRSGRLAGAAPVSADFVAAIRANQRSTFWLCVILVIIGMALGAVIGGLAGLYSDGYAAPVSEVPPSLIGGAIVGALVMLGLSLTATFVALSFGGSVVTAIAGAHDVSAEAEPQLHNVIEEMSIAAGVPKPRVVIIDTPALNAFATGTKPERAVVGVTRGLLDTMNRDELQGVIAHEMSHIGNRDILYMTAVAILVGLIVLICDLLRRVGYRMVRFGDRKNAAPGIIALAIVLVVSIVAPIAATLVRMAISRQREYLADATSVKLTRNPLGLVSALEKIGASTERMESPNRAIQHIFIANPLEAFGEAASALMSTHPPTARRIARLLDLR